MNAEQCPLSGVKLTWPKGGVRSAYDPQRPSAKLRVRRVVMEWGADYGSLRLKPPEPHHLAPLLGFLGDELTELGGRAGKRLAVYFDKLCPHRRIAESA
jgi:hypothetical protein